MTVKTIGSKSHQITYVISIVGQKVKYLCSYQTAIQALVKFCIVHAYVCKGKVTCDLGITWQLCCLIRPTGQMLPDICHVRQKLQLSFFPVSGPVAHSQYEVNYEVTLYQEMSCVAQSAMQGRFVSLHWICLGSNS